MMIILIDEIQLSVQHLVSEKSGKTRTLWLNMAHRNSTHSAGTWAFCEWWWWNVSILWMVMVKRLSRFWVYFVIDWTETHRGGPEIKYFCSPPQAPKNYVFFPKFVARRRRRKRKISSIESPIFQNFPPSAGFSGIYYLQYHGDLKSPPNKLLYHRTDFGKRAPWS